MSANDYTKKAENSLVFNHYRMYLLTNNVDQVTSLSLLKIRLKIEFKSIEQNQVVSMGGQQNVIEFKCIIIKTNELSLLMTISLMLITKRIRM